LLKAFAAGPATYDNTHLLLAGDGSLRREMECLVEQLSLHERVHFLGSRGDIPDLLAASDAFVFSSDHEGSPLSVLEAIAAGLPVVGTSVGGVPEMVPQEGRYLLVPRGNLHMLADSMLRLYKDGNARNTIRAASLKHAAALDVSHTVEAYTALYESLCDI
jgi:glycosyltransferase involved in cell wall biosynthesis